LEDTRVNTRYYQEELQYLRELGQDFAREHPHLGPMLAEASSDPDVERVLQGVAYLTGAIRERLDDDLPQLTQTLLEMTWPHYLRPLPSFSIVEFQHPSKAKITTTQRVPRFETEIDSTPVDGTACRFRTCYDVDFQPLRIDDASIDSEGRASIRVGFSILGGAKLEELALDSMRFYLHGDVATSADLHLWMMRHVERVEFRVKEGRRVRSRSLPRYPSPISPVGFDEAEALEPYPTQSFPGFGMLREFYALPQKFLFFDLSGFGALRELAPELQFEIVFHFSQRLPEGLRLDEGRFRLHCTPVVNLLSIGSEPLVISPERTSYQIRADDTHPENFEVFTIDSVVGLLHGRSERRDYQPFFGFRHGLSDDDEPIFFTSSRVPGAGRPNSDSLISFVSLDAENVMPDAETISIELTCTNRTLAEQLRPGDISMHTDSSPEYSEFQNLTPPTRSVLPPLKGDQLWRLISHLSINYLSIASVEGLRTALRLYDLHALYDRQAGRALENRLSAIQSLETSSETRLLRGAPVRGTRVELALDEEGFASEGEMYLFASVVEEFLRLYVSINSFSHLVVDAVKSGEQYDWTPRIGFQNIL
jgi:type VI secretion system protein ImpG